MSVFIFYFDAPAPILSLNKAYGMFWSDRRELTDLWRQAAFYAAREQINRHRIAEHQPFSLIEIMLPVKSLGVRRDGHNFVATTKPIIDGFVEARLFADDSTEHLVAAEPQFQPWPTVTVAITHLQRAEDS